MSASAPPLVATDVAVSFGGLRALKGSTMRTPTALVASCTTGLLSNSTGVP